MYCSAFSHKQKIHANVIESARVEVVQLVGQRAPGEAHVAPQPGPLLGHGAVYLFDFEVLLLVVDGRMPADQETIRYIQMKLDEDERSTQTRLQKVKEMIAKGLNDSLKTCVLINKFYF